MPRTGEEIREERRELRKKYGELFDKISAILFRADPVGIAFDNENLDEYELEAGTILPRLTKCRSSEDVRCVVHEEFIRWFGTDNAGPKESYYEIADDIW